jgi:hypothetical protein
MRKIRGKQIDLYTDSTFILESDELIPSQKATKFFVREKISASPDWNVPSTEKAPSVAAVKSYVSNAMSSFSEAVSEVTYAEANDLMINNMLKVGTYYKITDYSTKHLIPNTSTLNTAPTEHLLLLAKAPNQFNKLAISTTYADLIEYDFHNTLCEDGITPRNGFITRRIDLSNNLETPYDFRGVKFRRWQADTAALAWNSTVTYNKKDVVYHTDGFLYISMVDNNAAVFDITKWGKLIDFRGYVMTSNQTIIGNTIIPATAAYVDILTFATNCADIYIAKTDNSLNNITFGVNCEDITISPDCESLQFSNDCYHITVGATAVDNYFYMSTNVKLDSGSYSNTFASSNKVTLSMESTNNVFCEGVNDIVCGTGSDSIILYNGCEDIKFGNNCTNITLAGTSSKLSFPTMFQNKTFSNGISGVSFILQDTTTKTYNISGTHNVIVDMQSPNGDLWYRTIENDGTLSVQSLS